MWRNVLVSLAACCMLVSGLAAAQPPATPNTRSSTPLPTDAQLRVKQAIQSSFRVLPVQTGIILVPLSRRTGVDNIELRGGAVAVNGTAVTGAELRQRLGRDADAILELSYYDAATQRRLLIGAADSAAPPQGTPEAAPAPPSSEPEPVAPPEDTTSSSQPENRRVIHRVSHGRVRVGGSITVDEDEQVNGPVVAIGGNVEINGRVREAVVAIGGDVRLGPKAEISGDVTTVGGAVSRDQNAFIRGQVNEVDFAFPSVRLRPFAPWSIHVEPWWGGGPWRTVRLVGTLVRMGLFTLLAALILLLLPHGVERVDRTVRAEPWKAALVGFFAQLIFVPLLVVTILFLVISIIGIPLLVLVPFALLAFFVALLLGFTGTASAVAHAARDRFGWSTPAPFALLVVGLLLIWGLTMVGRVLALPGGPFALAAGLVLLVGFLVEYAAWTIGLGAALLTRFGRSGRLYTQTVPPMPPSDVTPGPEGL
jgi:hypothetical protein